MFFICMIYFFLYSIVSDVFICGDTEGKNTSKVLELVNISSRTVYDKEMKYNKIHETEHGHIEEIH